MPPETNLPEGLIAPLKKVTPVSKYLAMALFILMPFVGGWIGYTYAPERVVEVERVEVRDVSSREPAETQEVLVSQTRPHFLLDDETEIALLYKAAKTGISYFQTMTYSSRSSQIVSYDPRAHEFTKTQLFIDYAGGDNVSGSGRYISKLVNYESPTTSLEVYDLETMTIVDTIMVSSTETLMSGACGYTGPTFAINWTGSSTLRYGIYTMESYQRRGCDNDLIEYREKRY
jgi:hypothetical protein